MPDPIRIIAWGNKGRCDDGVALVLAERLQERYAGDADVCVQQYHQLGPELAADLDACRLAIFIDAHVRPDRPDVCLETVEPADEATLQTHHCHPPVLLALARSMQFKLPPVSWLVAIRAYELGFGDSLSTATAAAMADAERRIVELIAAAKQER
ncbi:MAG TPA: hydrogenase maturation protease [Phycisphaerae bacterium]|jgi:hydrogenase maturation protease|nr:hydrogenase maturation protease [Phycisphaerae bacterium]HOB74594.1 hydrogenase maturation protease [Phycisphaerae bacterium]HOJ53549.1 hydrogenase maturation protease [Phycisphaerae bacterium]HOL25294.1 hydrogenase maturation protease [Phycisphaerae bacterium]HPP20491.1 hydrogenase maturation protease [Phycisphaerae bacterium]